MYVKLLIIILLIAPATIYGQQQTNDDVESLKKEILNLRQDVDNIKLNLSKGENKFKRGILVATIGYSITITGGMMLGRKQDELGKGLLIAGGATGVLGTILMVDAFKYLGRAGKQR